MGAKGVRGIAEDPLAPLAGMVLAAMLLLGAASGRQANDGTGEQATVRPAAATSAVGKVYTPRLVLGDPAKAGGGHEAAAPTCAAVDARVSYRLGMAPVRVKGAGT